MKKIFVNLKDWLNLEQNLELSNSKINKKIVIFPSLPYVFLYVNKKNIELGTQNVMLNFEHEYKCGCISLKHLKDFQIKWILINHKDMPINNFEYLINIIRMCNVENINMIICVNNNVKKDINYIIKALNKNKIYKNIYIAYEPQEEITIKQIRDNIKILQNEILKKMDIKLPILFGGNINTKNITEYNKSLDISGYLISRGALKANDINKLIELLEKL